PARLRRRAGRHIGRCPVCARRLGQLNPARLVSLVPAPVVSAGLPQRIAGLTADAAPGAAAYRARIARGRAVRRGRVPRPADHAVSAPVAGPPAGGGRRRRRRGRGRARGGAYAVTDTAGHAQPPRAAATGAPAPEPASPGRPSIALAP